MIACNHFYFLYSINNNFYLLIIKKPFQIGFHIQMVNAILYNIVVVVIFILSGEIMYYQLNKEEWYLIDKMFNIEQKLMRYITKILRRKKI